MKKQIVIIYTITILSFINNIILSIDTYISININNVYKFMPIGNIYETIKIIIKYIMYFLFFIEIKWGNNEK